MIVVGGGVAREEARMKTLMRAHETYYAGIPRLGSAAIEAWRHPRTSTYAKDRPRPKLTSEQERARLRVSSRVIARKNPVAR